MKKNKGNKIASKCKDKSKKSSKHTERIFGLTDEQLFNKKRDEPYYSSDDDDRSVDSDSYGSKNHIKLY